MKKISLKNILRKTFKKPNSKKPTRKVKSVRKIEVTKKIKVAKVRKTNKKIVKKKITISPKTATGINLRNKTDHLRIPKSNEIKPEIKNIFQTYFLHFYVFRDLLKDLFFCLCLAKSLNIYCLILTIFHFQIQCLVL